MEFDITIGAFRVTMLDSVVIKRSVESLADTAVIKLPGTLCNRTLDIGEQIGPGDAVRIRLGYTDPERELPVEFEGYVTGIGMEEGLLRIDCEDNIRLFRRPLQNAVLTGVTVEELLRRVLDELGGLDLACDYDFLYDKFAIYAATGFDVLKKVQEETRANIYLSGTTLHVHPQYTQVGGKVIYDFAVNVEKSELRYKQTQGCRCLVEVGGTDPRGGKVKVARGTAGGDKISVELAGVSDPASLGRRAEEELKMKTYEGYEGSFTGWLVPAAAPADIAELRDAGHACKSGRYYVVAVETTFSSAGGSRKVSLGKKME